MKANREMLEDQQQRYETQLKGLKSYVKELKDMSAKHGTDPWQLEEDLREAECNIKYYEGEVARVKSEMGESGAEAPAKGEADNLLPRTLKQGLGSLIFSSISFVAGAVLGSKLKSGAKESKRAGEERERD
ncbi:MAG TPA: hypothetical protein VM095_17700 [Pyrinomonadaceae bacterium]|nr:hypothetical protein [Pyrinomonadaceae bacterium]